MLREDEKQMQERCGKATPGPWIPCERGADSPEFYVAYKDSTKTHGMALGTCFWPCHAPEETEWAENITYDTVEFIAHARTDLPEVLSRLEAERAAKEALEAQVVALREGVEKARLFADRQCGWDVARNLERELRELLASPSSDIKARWQAEALEEAAQAVEDEVNIRDGIGNGNYFVSTNRLRVRAKELREKANG